MRFKSFFCVYQNRPSHHNETVLVVANFDGKPQHLNLANLANLGSRGYFDYWQLQDLASGESPAVFNDELVIPSYRFYWLASTRSPGLLP